jgi:predicted anti-sigma-YlaC factor YlaD
MRCSSCEPLLDAHLEGTLSAVRVRAVAHHLRRCRVCEGLFDELRVVDALLATAHAPGSVGSDFTQAVVSATQAARPQRVKRIPVWLPLLAYLALAWAAVGFAVTQSPKLSGPFSVLGTSGERGWAAISAALRAVAPATAIAAATVTVVLLLDLLLFFAILYGYRRLRPRLAVYLARGSRS